MALPLGFFSWTLLIVVCCAADEAKAKPILWVRIACTRHLSWRTTPTSEASHSLHSFVVCRARFARPVVVVVVVVVVAVVVVVDCCVFGVAC